MERPTAKWRCLYRNREYFARREDHHRDYERTRHTRILEGKNRLTDPVDRQSLTSKLQYYTRNDDDPTTEMARLAAYLGPEDDITTRFDKSVVYRLIFKKTPKQAAEVVEKLRQKAAERKRREAAGLPPSP